MTDIARRIGSLSPEQRRLLELRLRKQGVDPSKLGPVPQRQDRQSAVLSFAQQRLWFLDQLEPGSPNYNLPGAIRVEGALDTRALGRSLNEIVRRHESLRTTFRTVNGQAVQFISPDADLPLKLESLEGLSPSDQEAETRRLAEEQAICRFDLSQGPLLRAALVRLSELDHVLLATMHHIVSDGWSLGIFVREMAALYQAFTQSMPSPLPPLPIQYADFASWQREWLQGETLESQRSYWKKQLDVLPPALELPADHAGSSSARWKGGSESLRLSPSLSTSLRDLSHRQGATLFMTLLTAFKLLLHRYAGQEDIVVGSPIAGRNRAEIEGLIGFFVNTLVLRTDLSGQPTFVELLKRVRDVTLGAYAHQDYPFERLVEDLHPDRDLGRNPFFQVLFNFINTPQPTLNMPGLSLNFVELAEPSSRFPMTMYVEDFEEALNFRIVYQSKTFSSSRMTCLLDQFRHLLERIVEAPERPIGAYSLVTAASRRVLPDPTCQLPAPRCEAVTDMFLSCARRSPDSPAVERDGTVRTYLELETRADEIAHHLINDGLKRGDVVAIAASRCFGLVAGMLGVLRAGGVLLVVDRDLPEQRRRVMIEEARARYALLVDNGFSGDLSYASFESVRPVDPETGLVIGGGSLARPRTLPSIEPDDAAYIFFTSGSAGTPKGVLGCHKGLGHFLSWQRETFAVGPRDRSAQLTALSFDVLMRDIFLPLISGGTLCLPPDDVDLGPDRIIPWLESQRIAVLHTVPTLAQMWLANAPAGRSLRTLRWVFFAGEPLPEALVRRWRETFPGAGEIVNLYGPTETTLAKFHYVVPGEPSPNTQPVGWPLPQTQALVLSEGDRLCGIGEPGEIVVRTPFRSLGYVNSPEENSKRFVKNPFTDDPGDLLYRTGDRGRYRPDGALEILGRLDHQVKIRGARIELTEIEAAVSEHPGVACAAVVASDDVHGDKRLVAYFTPRSHLVPRQADLRHHLREKLPEYMVPSVYVQLDAMPLTSSGKVDRRALPAPDEASVETDVPYVAPRTPDEEVLAGIWAEVLGRERIGVQDNFFDMGGHSLLATQVISRARTAFNMELSLRSLFENPTIAGLAGCVAAHRFDSSRCAPPLVRLPRSAEIPLSFSQERMWFLNQLDAGTSAYNTFRAIRLKGEIDPALLERCFNEIVRRHEALRTAFGQTEGRPFQIIAPDQHLSVRFVDLRAMPESDREREALRLASEEHESPFDLAHGPLIRVSLLCLGDIDHVLLLTIHHIISDGWSMRVLIQELVLLYQAFAASRPSPLPELPVQYADFALWQRNWLQGEVLEEHTAYWKKVLAGSLPVLELPSDRPRALTQGFQAGVQSLALPAPLVAALKNMSRQHGASLYMTLLACFSALLHRYTGDEDILIGAPIANRNRAETESLIGFFLNTLVLRTDLSGDPTFHELLERIRNVTFQAFAHQDLPLEHVLRAIQPERQLTRSSLFQAMFLLQNVPPPQIELPGLTFSLVDTEWEIDLGTAIFDVALTILEEETGLTASFTYNDKLFDQATIALMLDRYRLLLENAVANASQKISRLSLMRDEERRQLVAQSGGSAEPCSELMVHRMFEAQVERTPDHVAVLSEERRVTYGELNRRANQLARHLRTLGVGPEVRVAVCMRRCVEMIVALFGILKAGGAYVPIDPAYPLDRKTLILSEAGAQLLLTAGDVSLPDSRITTIPVDDMWERFSTLPETNLDDGAGAENMAYIIYTSGSTGKPKGVIVQHGSLGNYVTVARGAYDIGAADRVLQFASLSFDASAEEIYPSLACGATLVLRSDTMLSSFSHFLEKCGEWAISILDLPTAYWHELTKAMEAEGLTLPASVREIILGGERALSDRLRAWGRIVRSSVRLLNTYGPTESTIAATVFDVPRAWIEEQSPSEIPIGTPIPNAQALVLDGSLNLVPVGVPGELYTGGDCLARGYLDHPELTAERFVPNPFGRRPGERLYRTGDLARWRLDGSLEFLGRIDHQVKVRGYRIELQEVEAVLAQHPSIVACAVAARDDSFGGRRLVAYVVAAERQAPTISEIRTFLQERLPSYMVPAAIVPLDSLPLTPSGKLDRRMLPAPERSRPDLDSSFVAPANETEQRLADIWCDVLGIEQVGTRDNFFALGGHSLLLPQVIHRVREAFQVEVPLRDLFEDPTIGALGLVVEDLILHEIEQMSEEGVV